MRQRKFLFAIMALLLMFAACKGESPTSPSTTPSTPSTPTTPPTGATVTLTVSNASPLVNSLSVITATVSENGQPVPNGTAVQFTTTTGTFTDTGSSGSTVIKTTTNGVATATLTSGSAGAAVVTATVNNVSKTTTVTFSATPVTPTPPSTAPTVTSVTPSTGRPEGGEIITITGTNFRNPVRVIFTCEGSAATPPDPAACNGQTTKDALVTSVTPTQITAVTPAFNITTGQAVKYGIQVLVGAGTTTEATVSVASAFTFTSATLTPSVNAVTPASGPQAGGTRVTIIGSGFQAPVQVFFGSAEVQVIGTTFSQIIVMSPASRDTSPDGATPVTGPVTVRVRNINSGTEVSYDSFRYTPALRVNSVEPVIVSALTGQFHIDGIGFEGPVAVTVTGQTCEPDNKPFGFGLLPLKVSGTELFVRLPADLSPCFCANNVIIHVTNVNTGETVDAAQQIAISPVAPTVVATSIPSGGVAPNSSISVTILNPGAGGARFNVGSTTVTPTPSTVTTGTGNTTFNVVIPDATAFTFPSVACVTSGGLVGSQFGPLSVPLTFLNLSTFCGVSAGNITILPPAPNTCVAPSASIAAPAQTCPVANLGALAAGTPKTVTISIANAAGSPNLILSPPSISGATNMTNPTIAPSSGQTVPGGAQVNYSFQFTPTAGGGAATGATVTFTTNDPAKPSLSVVLCGTTP